MGEETMILEWTVISLVFTIGIFLIVNGLLELKRLYSQYKTKKAE